MKIAYSMPDDTVAIFEAAPKIKLERVLGPLTDEAYRAHVYERAIPADARNVTELPADWVPPDRAMRHLWRIRDGEVVIDGQS